MTPDWLQFLPEAARPQAQAHLDFLEKKVALLEQMLRLRRLENAGVIVGYHARLNPKALGHALMVFVTVSLKSTDEAALKAIGRVDVLLVPVGGFFTIDHGDAAAVVEALAPRVVVPMHFKTDKVDFPIAPVDAFLATQDLVERSDGCTLEVTRASLPERRVTILLQHAR